MISTIVTDLFGVVIDWQGTFVVEEIAEHLGIPTQQLLDEWAPDVNACDRSEMTQDEFFDKLVQKFNADAEELKSIFTHSFLNRAKVNHEVINTLKQPGLPVVLLSNIMPLNAKICREQGWFNHFDKVCLSCEIKAAKPDAAAYKATSDALHSCVFIDDRIENVEAAKKLGMRAIHYTSVPQLKKELTQKLNGQSRTASQLRP
jgi:putative hydrolase of the HAD superfamily